MGICKLESYRYQCDRCGLVVEFSDRSEAGESGWIQMPGVRARTHVLCPTDASKLDRFLMGTKTPAGIRFNDNEQQRWERSCT